MAEPFSIAASIAGLMSLGDTVYRLVFRYVRNVKNAEKEIIDLKRELEALTGTIHNIHSIAMELEQDELHTSSIRLDHVNASLNALYKLKKALDDSPVGGPSKTKASLNKLLWPYKGLETRTFVNDIRACRDTLALALSADNMYTLLKSLCVQQNIEHELTCVRKQLQERKELETRISLTEKRKKVLEFFLVVNPARSFNYNQELRHPTTGFWLIEDPLYQQWKKNIGKFLWMSGIPGAGKTILSTLIIQECTNRCNQTRAAAYFYCDYKDINSQNTVSLLGALASQLGQQSQKAFDLLEKYHDTLHLENGIVNTPKAQSLLEILKQMAGIFEDVRLVVDALEECGDKTRSVAKMLKELYADTHNVSLALLSRDETDIRDMFAPPFSAHIEIAAHTEDVDNYSRAEIESRLQEKRLSIRDPRLKEEIVNRLVGKADGMFRWVTCQLDHLENLINDGQIRAALFDLPIGLDETYRRLLERIPPSAASLVHSILCWTMYSPHSLSIDQLIEAASVEYEATSLSADSKSDEDTIRKHCSSLLRRARENRFEIAHFTVQEYLHKINSDDARIGKFRITRDMANRTLFKTCIAYLSVQDFNIPPPTTAEEADNFIKTHPFYIPATWIFDVYMSHGAYINEYKDLQDLSRCLVGPNKEYNFSNFYHYYFESLNVIYPEKLDGILKCDKFRPLHAAAMLGLSRLCQYLLDGGCDVNQMSPLGTPLHIAIHAYKHFDLTPLKMAYLSTMDMLIKAGAAVQGLESLPDGVLIHPARITLTMICKAIFEYPSQNAISCLVSWMDNGDIHMDFTMARRNLYERVLLVQGGRG